MERERQKHRSTNAEERKKEWEKKKQDQVVWLEVVDVAVTTRGNRPAMMTWGKRGTKTERYTQKREKEKNEVREEREKKGKERSAFWGFRLSIGVAVLRDAVLRDNQVNQPAKTEQQNRKRRYPRDIQQKHHNQKNNGSNPSRRQSV